MPFGKTRSLWLAITHSTDGSDELAVAHSPGSARTHRTAPLAGDQLCPPSRLISVKMSKSRSAPQSLYGGANERAPGCESDAVLEMDRVERLFPQPAARRQVTERESGATGEAGAQARVVRGEREAGDVRDFG